MLMYKIEKHPIVAFDATGSVVKKLLRPNGLSGNIFLYQGVLTGRDNSHVPMVQMLSERHDVQAITRWLSEVGREVVVHQLNVRRSKSSTYIIHIYTSTYFNDMMLIIKCLRYCAYIFF